MPPHLPPWLSFLLSSFSPAKGRVWSLEAELQQTTTDTVEAQKQIDSLLRDAGALEHRLLSTQQERDEAVASSAALEEKRLALQRRPQVEGTSGVEGQGLAAEQTREETGETAELKRLVEQLQGALAAADGGRKDGQSGVTVDDGDDGDGNVLRLVEQENGDARQERDRARGELQVLQKETEELRGRVAALVRETEALKAGAEGADARREEEKVTARLEATAAAAEEAAKAAEARASAEATLIQERNHSREERDEARQRVEDGRREFLDAQNIVRELKAEVAGMERERQERADRDEERREELLGALAEAKRRVVLQDEKIEGLTVAEDERVAEVSKLEVCASA